MFKRVMIGLFVLSAVALGWSEANAGCAVIPNPNGQRLCASWITGGSEIGVITFEGLTPTDTPPSACPLVVASGPSGDSEGEGVVELTSAIGPTAAIGPLSVFPVELKLVGTVRGPTDLNPDQEGSCGLRTTDNQFCDIKGVVFCGSPTTADRPRRGDNDDDDDDDDDNGNGSSGRRATTLGPLLVESDGLSQLDPTARGGNGRGFAAFRFQLSFSEQRRLCPAPDLPFGTDFRTFVAQEGFFEAKVTTTGPQPDPPAPPVPPVSLCVRERCSVDVNGLQPDDPRIYSCRRIRNQVEGACN